MLSQETDLTPWFTELPQLSWVSESLSPGYEPSYLHPTGLETLCLKTVWPADPRAGTVIAQPVHLDPDPPKYLHQVNPNSVLCPGTA